MKTRPRWQRGSRLGRGHLGEKEQTGRQGRVLGSSCWAPPCAQQPSVWGCSWLSGLPSPLTQPPTHSSRRPPIIGPVGSRGETDDPDPRVPCGQLFRPRQHLKEQQVDRRRPSDGPETPAPQLRASSGPVRPGNRGPDACPPGAADALTAARTSVRARVWSVHPGPACPSPWGSAAMTRPVPALRPRAPGMRGPGAAAVKFPRWSLWKQGLLSSVDPEDRRLREVPRLSGGLGCRSPHLKAPTGRLQSAVCSPRS